jgi:hypothetical protein
MKGGDMSEYTEEEKMVFAQIADAIRIHFDPERSTRSFAGMEDYAIYVNSNNKVIKIFSQQTGKVYLITG